MPSSVFAALNLPLLSVVPFGLLLLAVAVLPLVVPHRWHPNRNKLIVVLILALPVAGYLLSLGPVTGGASVRALVHELEQYVSFIALLGALYIVSGGIALRGHLEGKPLSNAAFLACGAVLANIIGTTGASMLLIRPVLRANQERTHVHHLPVFFIFLVSNLGGLLTPLGDPPLFLGFLNGVDFWWTLRLWQPWLLANGLVLGVFLVCDTLAYRREPASALREEHRHYEPLRLEGKQNFLCLAGVLAAVVLQAPAVGAGLGRWLHAYFPCPDLTLSPLGGVLAMTALGLLSLAWTPAKLHAVNGFSWGPILEVAIIFAGLFVVMVPALQLLQLHGQNFGVTQPWQYFWLTGSLSSFLDNAPTYLAFATMAAGASPVGSLMAAQPLLLEAISCGAVFMGANTYIGNGPNFMVKALAEEAGVPTPSFFRYLLYSCAILLPIFVLVTFVFFR